MQRTLIAVVVYVGFVLASNGIAQEAKSTSTNASAVANQKRNEVSASAAPSPQTFNMEEAEAKFKALLADVTLSGRWSSIKEGNLGPEKEDRYNIVSAVKGNGDSWVINARMKYGEKEFVVPIPVKIKWAGDTPVLTVDNVGMPGGSATYSARVLFYEKTYSGSWRGARGGGLIYGIITSGAETNQVEGNSIQSAATNRPASGNAR